MVIVQVPTGIIAAIRTRSTDIGVRRTDGGSLHRHARNGAQSESVTRRPRTFFQSLLCLVAVFVVLACTWPGSSQANEIESFYLEINPRSGPVNEPFALAVVVEGMQLAVRPNLVGDDDFSVRYIGPETRVEIVNGKMTTKSIFRYQLTAKREGNLTTPSAEIEISGNRYAANSLAVEVGPAGSSADEGAVVLEQEISPDTVFEGQQLILNLHALIRTEVFNSSLSDPTLDDFWHVALSERPNRRTVRNGIPFIEQVFRAALFPLRPGKLNIPARELHGTIRSQDAPFDPFGGDLFEHFFGANQRQIAVRSNALTVDVRPLPPAPRDLPNWSTLNPLVGKTSISVEYPTGEAAVGDSRTLTITVTSTGNLAPLNSLPLAPSPGVRVYEEAPEARNIESGEMLSMRKIFRYSLVALAPGEVRIPGPLLSYFDPQAKRYEVARGQDISFSVQGSAEPALSPVEESAEPPAQPTSIPLTYDEPTFFEKLSSQISVTLLLFLACAVGGGLLILRLARHRHRAGASTRQLLSTLDGVQTAEELRSMFGAYCQSIGLPASGTGEELRAAIRRHGGNEERARPLLWILDRLELHEFGGKLLTQDEIYELKAKLRALLARS